MADKPRSVYKRSTWPCAHALVYNSTASRLLSTFVKTDRETDVTKGDASPLEYSETGRVLMNKHSSPRVERARFCTHCHNIPFTGFNFIFQTDKKLARRNGWDCFLIIVNKLSYEAIQDSYRKGHSPRTTHMSSPFYSPSVVNVRGNGRDLCSTPGLERGSYRQQLGG